MKSLYKYIATLGFIGYLPVAPGTFGSMFAMLFFFFFKPPSSVHIFSLLAVTVVGAIASHKAEKLLNEKDSTHIVIDEFAGYALSVISLPHTLAYYASAFLLFRFFDILKPLPIRAIERTLPGGIGIMADDLIAGLYANLLLQAWIHLT